MNDNRMKRWMDAIDDDLLEEAQRPLPRAAPYRCQPSTKCHMCPPLLSVPSVYGTPTEKSITFRLHFRKIVCQCTAHGATSGLHSPL